MSKRSSKARRRRRRSAAEYQMRKRALDQLGLPPRDAFRKLPFPYWQHPGVLMGWKFSWVIDPSNVSTQASDSNSCQTSLAPCHPVGLIPDEDA
jgi:hypothetical protein